MVYVYSGKRRALHAGETDTVDASTTYRPEGDVERGPGVFVRGGSRRAVGLFGNLVELLLFFVPYSAPAEPLGVFFEPIRYVLGVEPSNRFCLDYTLRSP